MKSFNEFWKFYLSQHTNKANICLHVAGTLLAFSFLLYSLVFNLYFLLLVPLLVYSFAWFGHFIFEKNRPATFQYPFWSILGDLKLVTLVLYNSFFRLRKVPELFATIDLEAMIPKNHLLRKLDRLLDLSFIREHTKAFYCENNGRPSIM